MVRATAAEMLKLTVVHLPGHDATSYANMAATADPQLETAALPATLSTTDTEVIDFANRYAVRVALHSMWVSAGGTLSLAPEPVIMTKAMQAELKQLTMDTTADGFHSLDMIDEDA